jgi:transposase
MPPSLRGWLCEDHLAWFVLAAVEEMGLSRFYAACRDGGHGRRAHDPSVMVALLLYAYAKGQRCSRVIERECVEDIAYRVIAANQRPDDTTIARFRQRHEAALGRVVRRGVGAMRRRWPGWGRCGCDRRHEAARERLASLKPRLRADRA